MKRAAIVTSRSVSGRPISIPGFYFLQARNAIGMDVLLLIGRLAFVGIFLNSGVKHLTQREGMAAYARSAGTPAAELLVPLTGVMILAGGILLGIGVWADLGSLLLLAFIVPTAWFMHGFWRHDDPMERANQQAHFLKNMSMAGACLVAFYLFEQFGDHIGLTLGGPLF